MDFILYETIITYKVICPHCNQHFSVTNLKNIECKNCYNKGDVNNERN